MMIRTIEPGQIWAACRPDSEHRSIQIILAVFGDWVIVCDVKVSRPDFIGPYTAGVTPIKLKRLKSDDDYICHIDDLRPETFGERETADESLESQ